MGQDGELEPDPLELEHMIGFSAANDSSVQFHPTLTETFICYTGCLILIGSTLDPHQQEFLRGHNEEITCLALSPSGNLIASGQASSVRVPNSEAYVIVWDFKSRQVRAPAGCLVARSQRRRRCRCHLPPLLISQAETCQET